MGRVGAVQVQAEGTANAKTFKGERTWLVQEIE